jgi:hypothetical protein
LFDHIRAKTKLFFVWPPHWYYSLQEIVKYNFGVVPNGVKSIPNIIQVPPAVLEFNHADRPTEKPAHKVFSAHARVLRIPNNVI